MEFHFNWCACAMLKQDSGLPFYEVMDGLAFTIHWKDERVVVIIANETLVRMNLPESEVRQMEFLNRNLPLWQRIAELKLSEESFDSGSKKILILPRDMSLISRSDPVAC